MPLCLKEYKTKEGRTKFYAKNLEGTMKLLLFFFITDRTDLSHMRFLSFCDMEIRTHRFK